MNKESWYASKLSDMDVITISYTDDWVVDYDKNRGMYRVSYFQDNHFVDEHWFDAFEEREVSNKTKIIGYLTDVKYNGISILGDHKYIGKDRFEQFMDGIIKNIDNMS